MDPADTDAVRSALSSQGKMLGQHDQTLREVTGTLRSLIASVNQLSTRVEQLAVQPPASLPQPSPDSPVLQPATVSTSSREPYIPAPDKYSGKVGACGQFLLQCSLVFRNQPLAYPTDFSQVSFIINLLCDRAAHWALALWELNSPLLQSYPEFASEMKKVFDSPAQDKEVSSHLLSCRQGVRSVSDYSIEFRILAAESGWGDKALRGVFLRGLAENIKDELAARDETDSLDSLISLATRLDNRLRERRRERASGSHVSTSRVSHRVLLPAAPESLLSPARPRSPPSPAFQEEPMQLGRARLSLTERQRRMEEGLCIYCGRAGHYLRTCPMRPKDVAH